MCKPLFYVYSNAREQRSDHECHRNLDYKGLSFYIYRTAFSNLDFDCLTSHQNNSQTMDGEIGNGVMKTASNGVNEYENRRLTDDEFDRYSRQMIVPGMGKEGKICIGVPISHYQKTDTFNL